MSSPVGHVRDSSLLPRRRTARTVSSELVEGVAGAHGSIGNGSHCRGECSAERVCGFGRATGREPGVLGARFRGINYRWGWGSAADACDEEVTVIGGVC